MNEKDIEIIFVQAVCEVEKERLDSGELTLKEYTNRMEERIK